MRIALGSLIISFLAAASLPAQTGPPTIRDLVNLARVERARRAGPAFSGRVYTSEDVQRFVPSLETAAGGEAAGAGEPEVPGPDAVEGGPSPLDAWAAWQEELAAKQEEMQTLEDLMVQTELQVTTTRGAITGPTGTQEARNLARTELAAAETALARMRADMTQLVAELEELRAAEPPLPEQP